MSSPVLYKANETDFNHLGLGVLTDAVSCLVTEERNGLFELELEYPVEGFLFKHIKNDRLIKVDASRTLKDQRFKIIRISKPMKGIITVYAEHVSYLAQDLALKPDVSYSGVATQALNIWRNAFVDDHPFSIYSDVLTEGSGKWSLDKVENARLALGGVAGSLLDTYGGEYMFDNYHVMLLEQRGSDNGALIAYGRNLMELTEEEMIDSTYTSIYPYSIYTDDNEVEHLITLPEYFLDSQYAGNFARRKLLKIDFSEDEVSTVEDLRTKAESYLVRNNVGIPKVNQKIKFVDLARTMDYDDLQLLENISLCDVVTIYFEKFDLQTKAKVIKTVWDALLEQYDSIEVGESRTSLSRSIDATIDSKLENVTRRINSVQVAANGKNKVYRGADEPANGVKNDLWYRPVGEGEIEMYIHDGAVWHLEKYSGDTIGGTINFANVNGINFNASNIVTGTLEGLLIVGSQFYSYADDSENYVRIQSDNINSHGIFERTWGGVTDSARLNLGISRGRIMISNEDTGYNLYMTERGLSTSMAGAIDQFTSGTLEFHSQRFNQNSRGVTLHSSYGSVALVSDFSTIVTRSNLTNNIESDQFSVYIRPYRLSRPGTNEFRFWVKEGPDGDSTDGVLSYGRFDGTWGAGIRFGKGANRDIIYITNNNGDIGTGSIRANQFIGDLASAASYAYVRAERLRVVQAGADNQNYAELQFSDALCNSIRYHGTGDMYIGVSNAELRVTNNLRWNDGNPGYRTIRAAGFIEASSEDYKEDITPWDYDALSVIMNEVQTYQYKFIGDEHNLYRRGLIVERETPAEFISEKGINTYEMNTWSLRAIQQLGAKVAELENKLLELESA